jgi:protein TonB
MQSNRRLRLLLFLAVAAIHVLLLLLIAFNVQTVSMEAEENARVIKVTDLAELPPPPPEEIPQVEAIAETLIETETEPLQIIVAHGTITQVSAPTWDDYLPIHKVSDPPRFDERDIMSALVFPPIALRSGIEGRVILELFVDRNGMVQRISILQENPKDRGFGEAAVKAFTGRQGSPARANGEPVSARYRYPVSFKIK